MKFIIELVGINPSTGNRTGDIFAVASGRWRHFTSAQKAAERRNVELLASGNNRMRWAVRALPTSDVDLRTLEAMRHA